MCNIPLIVAIRQKGLTQREFARLVGDHESMVSRVINGLWNLDDKRKAKYAKVLKKTRQELFNE